MLNKLTYLILSLILVSCSGGGGGSSSPASIDPKFLSSTGTFSSVVSELTVKNESINIKGNSLDKIEFVKLVKNGITYDLIIDSKQPQNILAKTKDVLKFAAGETFSILIGNTYGQTVYTANFEIEDRSIQLNHIAGTLGGVGVTTGQVLKWNGSEWSPTTLGALTYLGTWNANTNNPDVDNTTPEKGSFYIVSANGSTDLNGITNWSVGDWAVYGDSGWERVASSSSVSSVHGRTGSVTAQTNDYTWAQINKTVSSIGDISDVNLIISPTDGQVLKYNSATSKWIAANDESGGGGSGLTADAVNNTHIANGAISQSKITNLTTDLAGKENSITAGTTAQYFRGDKTWQTLDTLAVVENTNLYFTDARARTASVVDNILDGVVNTAPSQNAVYDALNLKLNQSSFVDWGTSGIQTIDPSRIDLAANNRAVVTDGSGLISTSNVTATELSYVSGVTSAIQNQINTKQNTLTTGSITSNLILNGTITNEDIDGNISQSKIENLTSDLSNKQDISTLISDVKAIVLDDISFATNAAVATTDTILSAFGKLQAQITALTSSLNSLDTRVTTVEDQIAEGTAGLAADDVGRIDAFAVDPSNPPPGYLYADGSSVSRTTYADLFAKIGTSHGSASGTTFNLPDYRGRFLRGVDGTANRDPDKASRTAMNAGGNTGNNVGSVQGDQFRSHRHSGSNYAGDGNGAVKYGNSGSTLANGYVTDYEGGNETRPINANVSYFIKYIKTANIPTIKVAYIKDIKAANTNGGSSVAGQQVRELNNLVDNSSIVISLSSNQFTLAAGTYQLEASVPAYSVNTHTAKLRNVTDTTDVIVGSSSFAPNASNGMSHSLIQGEFTITSQKTFSILHYTQAAVAGNGLGTLVSSGDQCIYTQVKITKIR